MADYDHVFLVRPIRICNTVILFLNTGEESSFYSTKIQNFKLLFLQFLPHQWSGRKTSINPLEPISIKYYSELKNNLGIQFSLKASVDYTSYKCKGLTVILHTFSDNIHCKVKTLTTHSSLYQPFVYILNLWLQSGIIIGRK